MTSSSCRALPLVLALWATAARAGAPPSPEAPPLPPPSPPPPGAERVELDVRFPPWEYTGSFRLRSASGAISDEGVASDEGGLSLADRPVERVLQGARGTIVIRVTAPKKTATFPSILARWTVVRGTGAYAHLTGGGTLTGCTAGDAGKGSPFERQTMLGYLQLR